jgi:alpha-1,3-rhamnosyl/mannosyltransferase
VCIDARMAGSSGIGTYLQGLFGALRNIRTEVCALTLLGNPEILPEGPWRVRPMTSPIYSLREQWSVPCAARQVGADLLHSPHYNMPCLIASHTVVTVHDMIHLKFPQFWPSRAAQLYAHFFFHHVVSKARAILTVSEHTKRDLMETLAIPGNRITVTYPGVDHARFLTPDVATRGEFDRLNLPSEYLLYVGNLKEFKNVPRLVEAYRRLRARRNDCPALILAGRNFIPGFEQEIAAVPGLRWIGEVSRELLPHLYKHALLFIFPSLYEGFGLPPLEAMAAGTPVLCSNRASLPEVVGDAAMTVDPESTEELTAAMDRLIQDSTRRKELSAKGIARAALFSWEKMAAQTLKVYQECLS